MEKNFYKFPLKKINMNIQITCLFVKKKKKSFDIQDIVLFPVEGSKSWRIKS